MSVTRPTVCKICKRKPEEIPEYKQVAKDKGLLIQYSGEPDVEIAVMTDKTYDSETGEFVCPECIAKM